MARTKHAMRPSGFSGDDVPGDVRERIGDLVIRWAYIEFQIGVLLREGFNIPTSAGFALIFGSGLKPLARALRTLGKSKNWIKDESIRKELTDLARAVSDAKDQRHTLAHGVFGLTEIAPGVSKLFRYRFDDMIQWQSKPPKEEVSLTELDKLIEQARDLGIKAQDATTRLKQWKRSTNLPVQR